MPAKVSSFQTSCENRRLYRTHIAADHRGERLSSPYSSQVPVCVRLLPPFRHRIVAPKSLEAAVVCFGMEAAARDAQQLRSFVFDFLPFPKGANFFRRLTPAWNEQLSARYMARVMQDGTETVGRRWQRILLAVAHLPGSFSLQL